MFCPVGFKSVAELWAEYRQKRGEGFYVSSTRHYHSAEFHPAFTRGSPLDVCEHVFLKSIAVVGPCLAGPDGRVMKVHSPLEDGRNSLFSVLNYQSSANAAVTEAIEAGTDDLVVRIGGPNYQSFNGTSIEASWWRELYPLARRHEPDPLALKLENIRFHCLPLCFERGRYCLVEALPRWAGQLGRTDEIDVLVRNFGGWAACLTEEAVERWQPYLEGQPVYPESKDENAIKPQGGRPDKQKAALADFRAVFPEGPVGTKKEQLRRIEEVTGNRHTETTLRRALKSQDGDQ